jgi:phosphatidylinositol alpha-mannosyltransferase
VDVLAPADGGNTVAEIVPLGRTIGVPDNGSVTRIPLSPRAFWTTGRAVRRGYDVVHVHEPMLPPAGVTALLNSPAPVVGTFHMAAKDARWYRTFAPAVRALAGRLEARIAVSEQARRFVARVLPGRYLVIPNGIDAGMHGGEPARRSGRRVVFVGRPDRRKGLDVLLAAFGPLAAAGATLDLVGVRPDDVEGRAVWGDAVCPHGVVSERERTRILAQADVLCAPSRAGESFGLVIAEGMAAGLPVVASALPGYRAVLPERCGRLVPPGDPGALRDALSELLADPGLRARMGAAGAARVRQHYRLDQTIQRYHALYRRLTGRA